MGFESNDSLQKFIDDYKRPPQTYLAMQAEGREWLELFSKETIDQFDQGPGRQTQKSNRQGLGIRNYRRKERLCQTRGIRFKPGFIKYLRKF